MNNSAIGALDIGGTKIAIGIISPQGEIFAREEISTEPNKPYEDSLQQILAIIKRNAIEHEKQLIGVGIGCTGQVSFENGQILMNAFLPTWVDKLICSDVQASLNVPAYLENDADAAALAEFFWGAGKNKNQFIYTTISTGIGGGIILDGRIYRGWRNQHPEIGHHCVDPNGPQCFCGRKGCWETLASGRALERRWADLYNQDKKAQEIYIMARDGSNSAREQIQFQSFWVGIGLANLIHMFAPDGIALGGGVSRSYDLLAPRIFNILVEECKLVKFKPEMISFARLEPDTGLLGAAAVFVSRNGLVD